MEQRDSIDFKSTEVRKLFLRFLLPTVMGMISSAVFIVTDGIFVGRGIGSDALAAVNLIAPIYTLATGFGLMFGIGCSVVASINLSQGKQRTAGINLTQVLTVPPLIVVLVTIIIMFFDDFILSLLGCPGSLEGPGHEYLVWFTPFLMPLTIFYILMFAIRLDGAPNFVMYCNITAAGLNIILDYVFIFMFGWGLAGAAAATGIGYVIGAVMMFWYIIRRCKTLRPVRLKLSSRSMRLTARNIWYMMFVGFPAMLSELSISFMMIVGNYAFIRHLGKDGVAAYSEACYLFPIIFMINSGIIQAAQPIISYNYGAGQTKREQRAYRLALCSAAGFGTVICAATWLGGDAVASMFLSSTSPAYHIASHGLPLFALGYLFFGINVVTTGYLQSTEHSKAATVITLLRGIVLVWICFLALPVMCEQDGIWLAVPAAELITAIGIIIYYIIFRHKSDPASANLCQSDPDKQSK